MLWVLVDDHILHAGAQSRERCVIEMREYIHFARDLSMIFDDCGIYYDDELLEHAFIDPQRAFVRRYCSGRTLRPVPGRRARTHRSSCAGARRLPQVVETFFVACLSVWVSCFCCSCALLCPSVLFVACGTCCEVAPTVGLCLQSTASCSVCVHIGKHDDCGLPHMPARLESSAYCLILE